MPLVHRTGRDRDRPDTVLPFFTVVQLGAALAAVVAASWLWGALGAWPVEWRWLPPFFALLAGMLADRPVARGRTPIDRARARAHYLRARLFRKRVDWHV